MIWHKKLNVFAPLPPLASVWTLKEVLAISQSFLDRVVIFIFCDATHSSSAVLESWHSSDTTCFMGRRQNWNTKKLWKNFLIQGRGWKKKQKIPNFNLGGSRFGQAQPKPRLSWAEWLYFQLIQPPPPTHPHSLEKVYFSAEDNLVSEVEYSR